NGNPVTTPDLRYFQTRPSATTPADNSAATAFSNAGPNNIATKQALAANLASYLSLEKPYVPTLTPAHVPVDAVDTSASGTDPDMRVATADIEAHGIASGRHLPLAQVDAVITHSKHGRGLGFSGEPGVNVMDANLALDRMTGGAH